MNETKFKTSAELKELHKCNRSDFPCEKCATEINNYAINTILPLTEAYEKMQTEIRVDTPKMITLNAEITQQRDQLKAQLAIAREALEKVEFFGATGILQDSLDEAKRIATQALATLTKKGNGE